MAHPPFSLRKRAPITGTSFDFIRMRIPCPQCHKQGLQPLAELEVNTDADCPYCGAIISLQSPDIRARIREQAKVFKEVKPLKRG